MLSLTYEISRILFFLIFSNFSDASSDLFFEKTSKISKMFVFLSRNAYFRSDDPAIFCARHCLADMLCVQKYFGTPLVVEY